MGGKKGAGGVKEGRGVEGQRGRGAEGRRGEGGQVSRGARGGDGDRGTPGKE